MSNYDKIKKTIRDKYEAAGIESIMTPAKLIQQNESLAYEVHVVFSAGKGKIEAPYRMGIGHFEGDTLFSKEQAKIGQNFEQCRANYEKFGCYNCQILSEELTKKYFKPEQIFSCICSEARDSVAMSVEEYCKTFFNNADSHKGHLSHAECLKNYLWLNVMIGKDLIEELSDLYNEL